jgi:hypothetical protein
MKWAHIIVVRHSKNTIGTTAPRYFTPWIISKREKEYKKKTKESKAMRYIIDRHVIHPVHVSTSGWRPTREYGYKIYMYRKMAFNSCGK